VGSLPVHVFFLQARETLFYLTKITVIFGIQHGFRLMNILIIGNGGREHAFAWKIRQSTQCSKLYVAPGNAGTAAIAENVPIAVDNFAALGSLCCGRSGDSSRERYPRLLSK
jgi:hypothetical protein